MLEPAEQPLPQPKNAPMHSPGQLATLNSHIFCTPILVKRILLSLFSWFCRFCKPMFPHPWMRAVSSSAARLALFDQTMTTVQAMSVAFLSGAL